MSASLRNFGEQSAGQAQRRKPWSSRNPFPDSPWFAVPLRLHEVGLAAYMSGLEFKRFVTLWRISNFDYGKLKIRTDLKELEKLDGVSGRTAFEAHTKLEEYGLIHIDRHTKPFTDTLISPEHWACARFRFA